MMDRNAKWITYESKLRLKKTKDMTEAEISSYKAARITNKLLMSSRK